MKESLGKRVLMLVENNSYPEDPRVRQEALALVRAGYPVSVICPSDAGLPWREVLDGVHIFRYPAPPYGKNFLGYVWEYSFSLVAMFFLSLQVWYRPGFDIIHAANPPDTSVLIAAFYKLFGKKFVFDHHDLAPEMYEERFEGKANHFVQSLLLRLEKLSCKLANWVIATNQSYKQIEVSRDGVPAERVTIVRNGPDLERLKLVAPDPALRRRASTIIAFAGSISRQDGVDYLIRALNCLRDDLHRRDFYCVIVGKGAALAGLKTLVRELHLEEYIWLTGFIPDEEMIRYLSTAHICVDPDPFNPFNDRCTMIKMMEYMALGKAIVAFDLTEHKVTAGDAALYAKPNEELDLARKIEMLMDDPDLRARMGKIGRERVEQQLDWALQLPHLIEAYQQLTCEKTVAPFTVVNRS